MNHKRDERKDQKQMNQEARDMVHNKASDPGKNQQHGDGEPNKPTHKPSNESPLQYEPEWPFLQTADRGLHRSSGTRIFWWGDAPSTGVLG
jgi:hypothetical protein